MAKTGVMPDKCHVLGEMRRWRIILRVGGEWGRGSTTNLYAALLVADERLDGDCWEAVDMVDIAALVVKERRERHVETERVAAHERHQ